MTPIVGHIIPQDGMYLKKQLRIPWRTVSYSDHLCLGVGHEEGWDSLLGGVDGPDGELRGVSGAVLGHGRGGHGLDGVEGPGQPC